MAETGTAPSDAAAAWRDVLSLDPFDPIALTGLGRMMLRQGHPAQAVPLLLDAVENGADGDTLTDLCAALIESGQAEDSEPFLRRSIAERPGSYPDLNNLGHVLLRRGATEEALAVFRQALDVAPRRADAELAIVEALVAQGNALFSAGDMPEAERYYREAIGYGRETVACHTNLGNALTYQLRLAEAHAAFRTALGAEPANDAANMAFGLSLLLGGDEAGWRHYEARRRVEPGCRDHQRRLDLPQWNPGVDLTGRRVLITAEQGTGDLIQYARFAPVLADIAATVVLEVTWALAPILRDLPGVSRVITLEDKDHGCDVACPIVSLPMLLGPGTGMAPPYVTAPPERLARWAAWLDRSPPGRRIGLVCAGDPRHQHDARRSIPLADLTPLLQLPDTEFVLLQTEIREADQPTFDATDNLRCPAAALADYGDTAALIAGLDLVVSVDTSVAHLAGAMNRPVWTLLPFCPDYRWGLERPATGWYPSMRLFRQDRPGNWQTVIERVRADLANKG